MARRAVVGGGVLGCSLALALRTRRGRRRAHRVGARARRSGQRVAARTARRSGAVVGPALPRHAALRRPHAGHAGRARPRPRAAVGRDEDRLLRPRRQPRVGVEQPRVPEAARPQPGRQGAPGPHHHGAVADHRRAGHGAHRRAGLAHQVVGQAHVRAVLAPAAAGQAGRRLPAGLGRVHLGDDPTLVRRPAQWAQEGDVRLRAGWLRPGLRALR